MHSGAPMCLTAAFLLLPGLASWGQPAGEDVARLCAAAERGDVAGVRKLLGQGFEPNAQTAEGNFPPWE